MEKRQRMIRRTVQPSLLAAVLASLLLAGTASAELTGEFVRFKNCPRKAAGVHRCAYSEATGGEVKLGSKTVPIVNTVTLQGGYTKAAVEGPEEGFAKFIAAINGPTLTKTPQPVPGGLLGLVPPEEAPPLVKAALKVVLENGLTGVNATLEIAGSPSDIRVNELSLALGEGVALIVPVKVRLENPFLGNNCYIGSDVSPIVWNLGVDLSSPGQFNFLEGGEILEVVDVLLADDTWSAPSANGCAGLLSALVDPIIDTQAGLPAASGNDASLLNTLFVSPAFSVNQNDEQNP